MELMLLLHTRKELTSAPTSRPSLYPAHWPHSCCWGLGDTFIFWARLLPSVPCLIISLAAILLLAFLIISLAANLTQVCLVISLAATLELAVLTGLIVVRWVIRGLSPELLFRVIRLRVLGVSLRLRVKPPALLVLSPLSGALPHVLHEADRQG